VFEYQNTLKKLHTAQCIIHLRTVYVRLLQVCVGVFIFKDSESQCTIMYYFYIYVQSKRGVMTGPKRLRQAGFVSQLIERGIEKHHNIHVRIGLTES